MASKLKENLNWLDISLHCFKTCSDCTTCTEVFSDFKKPPVKGHDCNLALCSQQGIRYCHVPNSVKRLLNRGEPIPDTKGLPVLHNKQCYGDSLYKPTKKQIDFWGEYKLYNEDKREEFISLRIKSRRKESEKTAIETESNEGEEAYP